MSGSENNKKLYRRIQLLNVNVNVGSTYSSTIDERYLHRRPDYNRIYQISNQTQHCLGYGIHRCSACFNGFYIPVRYQDLQYLMVFLFAL